MIWRRRSGSQSHGLQGFNCTIPHKVKVIQYLDGLGQSAALMGAVNCVVRRDGQWIGKHRRKRLCLFPG